LILIQTSLAQKKSGTIKLPPPTPGQSAGPKTFSPVEQSMKSYPTIKLSEIARQEALEPSQTTPAEIKPIHAPKGDLPEGVRRGVTIAPIEDQQLPQGPAPSTAISPPPSQSFKGQELLGGTIPPDTGGAVGTTHIVTATNDRLRIMDRNGVIISTVTLSSFWAGVTLEGGAPVNVFDPKLLFDRFNNRFIFIASANAQSLSSAALIAVSATADPTGAWFRYSIDADPAATATAGHWIDYPTVGHNKNWIVLMENVFNYGTLGGGFFGPTLYVIDKANLYTGPVSPTVSTFIGDFNGTCLPSATPETEFACAFTSAPAVTEDNTTNTEYLVEDWDNINGQLRLGTVTGTAAAPVLTMGTQFPQSTASWQFNAGISPSGSGGYALQRQQAAFLTSGTRVAQNDSRIQDAVLRNGKLWTAHTVLISTTELAAGVSSSAANPHNHSAIQWWQIDPTIVNAASGTPPLQRARIADPTADNCNNNAGGSRAGCTAKGQFFAFPHISVNQSDDVLIGFSRFSDRTYGSAAYAFRSHSDPVNTIRDAVIFRPGQANYNIGGGSPFTIRWGDMSHAQTDPLNDTDFWTTQEYADVQRDVGIGIAGTWSTWWARVSPSTPAPSTGGGLLISEFRLRGPQGVRDEFVELYNPSTNALMVTTTDGSDGWTLAYSADGTAITGVATIPVGTVIPAKGHFLITDNQVTGAGPTATYSLSTYPNTSFRDSGGDSGYALDLADNGGLALFKTTLPANFVAGNRLDSVGFSGIAAGLFKEGTGLPPITAATPTGQMSYVRQQKTGEPQDTGANENDFVLVNPVNELTPTPVQGAAGPQNLNSPIARTTVPATLVAPCAAATAAPNRVRTGSGNSGTLEFRRTFTNNTGAAITRLRFRVIDITTSPSPNPATTAILSIADSVSSTPPTCPGGTVSLVGLTIEQPPTQSVGGGLNSTLTTNTVTLAAPLANGASINVNFMTNVILSGSFKFFINVEALP